MHCARIKSGAATYSNHCVRTSRLRQELAVGWPLVPKFGDYVGLKVGVPIAVDLF